MESSSGGYSRSYLNGSLLRHFSVLKENLIIDLRYEKQGPGPSKKELTRAKQFRGLAGWTRAQSP